MPVTKQQKQQQYEQLRGELQTASTVLVTSFDRLTVAQDFELRQQIRAAGGRYRVIKNTIARRAAEGLPASAVLSQLQGVTSIAYTAGDAVQLAKKLQGFIKDNPSLTFKAALVEGRAITVAEIAQLAALPSKQELYAKLLYLIQAPAQRLLGTIAAAGRQTVTVIDQGVKQQKFAS